MVPILRWIRNNLKSLIWRYCRVFHFVGYFVPITMIGVAACVLFPYCGAYMRLHGVL
jgi:hypothetical protein